MAHLNKLAIRGIRAFDDKSISVIEFFSPVTVIVGHNGSGKTTVIECLKYATTGDQPPNTRGGAFVHDPKMANEKEVKAQVRLKFHAANGARMLVTRNLSVTMKKNGALTMKTLENVLTLEGGGSGGKRGTISTKCAELDAEIPHLLGVSKAVLENVIFCHQEDSYWPLAEPAALKKKFDDIFEATRYTKALTNIKDLRKERVAELKAEKERLSSLQREKQHSDKLKSRIAELNSSISSKEIEYEETKKQYESIAEANQKFYEYAGKFRDMYKEVEALEEKKRMLQADYEDAKLNCKELSLSEEELQAKLESFDEDINQRKQKRRVEDDRRQELEEEMDDVRRQYTHLVSQLGGLKAEAEAQENRLAEREQLIHEIGDKFGIKGYSHSPLEREEIVNFLSRLNETQRKQRNEYEKLQTELQSKTDDYNRRQRELDNALSRHKLEKDSLRNQITERQSSITTMERKLEDQVDLSARLEHLEGDIKEKRNRITTVKSEMEKAQWDTKIADKTHEGRKLEEAREALNKELSTLSLQANARAKLDHVRSSVKTKTAEVASIMTIVNTKMRKLGVSEVDAEKLDSEVSRLSIQKEQQCSELEQEQTSANNELQRVETTLSNLKAQLKSKTEEAKALDRRLKAELQETEFDDLETALKEAAVEVEHRRMLVGSMSGGSAVYDSLLKVGKQKKTCSACNRHMNDQEFAVFEKCLQDLMKKASPDELARNKAEQQEWEEALESFQKLRPVQSLRDQIRVRDIPALEKQIKEQEEVQPGLVTKADEVLESLDKVKRELKTVLELKEHTKMVAHHRSEISRASDEASSLESDLRMTGSSKTADEVQGELDRLSVAIRQAEREKTKLSNDRENQRDMLRALESSLHTMELKELDLRGEIKEKTTLEERIEEMKQEITGCTERMKKLDASIVEARAPLEELENQFKEVQAEMQVKIAEAQRMNQHLNLHVDKLAVLNKGVERYVKDKKGRLLEDCSSRIEEAEGQIKELDQSVTKARELVKTIDNEISSSGAQTANLRENIRIRRLERDIQATQEDIDSHDMEEAAKARRNFEEKYGPAKEKENNLNNAYVALGGELSSDRANLRSLQADLKEFKDVNKKYTDQLIRVKMSDMANSDLEKYAKALDNAIMKYHGLKMEEVNDTMKHLWNKTYQGTDIDGIKIVSDAEGGNTARRSYNYRVVMTKDQVEMDMRGRCSAGQKMLASIIIRLALSDSFGQNCGILALDEPTNALDTENIEALADSLVDIINERKSHSNFQLIIITHDENFLKRLGQSDVMEYYWRVSRNERQKSEIVRQRVRDE